MWILQRRLDPDREAVNRRFPLRWLVAGVLLGSASPALALDAIILATPVALLTGAWPGLGVMILVATQTVLITLMLVSRVRQRRATSLLRERDGRLQALLNAPLETMLLISRDRTLLSINENGARRLGTTPEAMIGRHVSEFLPPELLKSRQARMDEVLRTGAPVRFEDERAGACYANTIYPVSDPDNGEVIGVSIFARDVTEQKEAVEALSQSEARSRNLMEQSPLAMEILSREGQILQVNPAWRRLWGLNEVETAAALASYNMLTDKQLLDRGVDSLVRQAFDGQAVVLPPFEYAGTRAMEEVGLGHIKARSPWIQCHLYPVMDKDGGVTQIVNTYMDITDLKMAETDAREQRDALARVDRTRSMGQLTGSIAHELNQPLTGILSNAQAAELLIKNGQCHCEEMGAILADIVADTKRASGVMHSLRDLYREQKGEFQPVDLAAVIHDTFELLHGEAAARNATLESACTPDLPIVQGNRTQLQQVLVNLIMNALEALGDAADDKRCVRLATACEAGRLRVWVADSGSGLDDQTIDRIFEPLATWKPGGTGMGLAISNAIIQAHGGQMNAKNRPGGGASVGFWLPI